MLSIGNDFHVQFVVQIRTFNYSQGTKTMIARNRRSTAIQMRN